jgi:hypothetical protein
MLKPVFTLVALSVMGTIFFMIFGVDKTAFEIGSYSANIFLAFIQIFALYLIYSQLKHQKRLSIAQFVSSIMEQLATQKEFHRKLVKNLDNPNEMPDIDEADIVAFLNVFENLSAVVESGVISISDIDQPFAYRFFLTTNNKTVQELELIPDGKYYKSIYRLHKQWISFRKENNLPQIGSKSTRLDYSCADYEELAKFENHSNKSI